MEKTIKIAILFCFIACHFVLKAQPVPAEDENIPFLVTFSKEADRSWGDDDYVQSFFFSLPVEFKKPFYLRVFDPDCGGAHDEQNIEFNSATRFSVYGGNKCITDEDARDTDPVGNFKSGNLLASKTFGANSPYDDGWYTFGPFNPSEGENVAEYGGNIFKLIAEGIRGDDGNLYRYFMSTDPNINIPVEGGNAFTFEYTFRMHADPWQVSHVYPLIDDEVISLLQYNFDWDDDGFIRVISVVTVSEDVATSGDNRWSESTYEVKEEERGKSLDIQFIKSDKLEVNNNNVVFYITNQYGELLPFFTIPIGGIPRPKGKPRMTPSKR